jgi:prepilin-type N-terminal cleavage/methylation domain-containing protein
LFLHKNNVQLSHMKNARGFTLVEILVVVVIITILATIGTLTYAGFQSQSRDQKRSANAHLIADSLERYYEKNGEYPSIVDVTNPDVTKVKNLLNITDTSALVMPNAPSTITNSIKGPSVDPTPSIITYNASVQNTQSSAMCETTQGGGCDSFTLQWEKESGEPESISSRNKDRIGVLQAPQNPIMTASLVGGAVTGKVTHGNTSLPVCSLGTPQYKILSNTSDFTPDWSTTSWQASDTKVITNPVPSTEYFFYAIARCTSPDGGDIENSYVAKDSFYYYTIATMTARWNGTTAEGAITAGSALPICQGTQTAKYFIQSKVDTVSAAGQWTPASAPATWPTTNVAQIPNSTNPRKISFRGQVRCDNTSTGAVEATSVMSNIDFVISAPATPELTRASQSGSWIRWTWTAVACPVGTTTIYDGSYEGNFPDKAPIATVSQSDGVTIGNAYRNGYTYGFGVSARCDKASSKVLSSGKPIDIWQGGWPVETYVEKGKLFSVYTSGATSVSTAGVYIQNAVAGGGCESGSNRRIRVDMQKNGAGSDTGGWSYVTDYMWNPGAGNIEIHAPSWFQGSAGTNYEARIGLYCSNAYGGRPGFQLFERYGTLHVINNPANNKPSRSVTNCNGPSRTVFDTDTTYGLDNIWLHCEYGNWSGNPDTSSPVRNANRWNAWQDSWQ